jgi:hypothetical protein
LPRASRSTRRRRRRPNRLLARVASPGISEFFAEHHRAAGHTVLLGTGVTAQAGVVIRLESVQNAVDRARSVAAAITGESAPYADAFARRLQRWRPARRRTTWDCGFA